MRREGKEVRENESRELPRAKRVFALFPLLFLSLSLFAAFECVPETLARSVSFLKGPVFLENKTKKLSVLQKKKTCFLIFSSRFFLSFVFLSFFFFFFFFFSPHHFTPPKRGATVLAQAASHPPSLPARAAATVARRLASTSGSSP